MRTFSVPSYFLPLFEDLRNFLLKISELEIDNKELRKRLQEQMDEILTDVEVLCSSLETMAVTAFKPEDYGRIKNNCLLKDRTHKPARRLKKLVKAEGEKSVVNEELREKLQEWRTERFKADNVPAYTIMHQSTLMEIASLIPKTKSELLSIKGFGKAKFDKYGEDILKITADF